MKKLFIFLILSFFSIGFTHEKKPWIHRYAPNEIRSSYNYFDLGISPLPMPILNLGAGIRQQFNHNGFDASLQIVPSFLCIKGNLAYNYYFFPNRRAQTYCGFGLSACHFFYGRNNNFLTPNLILGREWRDCFAQRTFVQFRTNWPYYSHAYIHGFHNSNIDLPLMELSYGIGF